MKRAVCLLAVADRGDLNLMQCILSALQTLTACSALCTLTKHALVPGDACLQRCQRGQPAS